MVARQSNHLLNPQDDVLISVYLPSGRFQPMRLAATDPAAQPYRVITLPGRSGFNGPHTTLTLASRK